MEGLRLQRPLPADGAPRARATRRRRSERVGALSMRRRRRGNAAARQGGYTAWLRVKVSPAAETEINVQLGELTLKSHHMQLLEPAVSTHSDFLDVFGDNAENGGRHQCAEVRRSSRRRWLRLMGTRHDLQIWAPDDREPPAPRVDAHAGCHVAVGANDARQDQTWRAGAGRGEGQRVRCQGAYALLSVREEEGGGVKEIILQREPAALHVFNVVEHGRRWLRELIYTSDVAAATDCPSRQPPPPSPSRRRRTGRRAAIASLRPPCHRW